MPSTLIPTNLRCEYLTNPLGMDVTRPRLSWTLQDQQPGGRGQGQSAYQVCVASSQELLAAQSYDLWDSGKIDSSQCAHVVYQGKALSSGMRCYWQVRIWDRDGQPTSYSAPAWWEMGLLEAQDWRGQWIGLSALQVQQAMSDRVALDLPGLQPAQYLRKSISITKPLTRARLYATAKGVYEASLNGQRVGDAYLTPGWTDYGKRIQYQTYDVTTLLRSGANTLGALLGTGWYCGYVGFPFLGKNYHHYGTEPRLLMQLHLDYTDGTSEVIATDQSWLGATGPVLFSDLLMGETYDARREHLGWDTPGSTGEGWQTVTMTARDDVPLVADRAQPVQITETLTPRAVTEVAPGVFVVDMGQNMVGWVRLQVQGEAGTTVRLRFAEVLNPDGTLYRANLRSARQTDTYILKGNGLETYEPHFTFHGFRYVELTGYPGTPTLATITGLVVHSATPATGTFECSHPMVNQLQHNILWGQRGNFLSVPTDCPQRDERLGWMGDAQIFAGTACYNMDVAAFFTKWLFDVADGQSERGSFPDVAPRLIVTTNGAPAWGDAGIIVPWTIYQAYGDTHILRQHYDTMKRWVAYIQSYNPDLLWTERLGNNYGDWLSIDADTPKEVLATAYFAYDAWLLANIAAVLGYDEEAQRYRKLFQAVGEAFRKAYVGPDGTITGETQTCYVLALHMQLLPPELRQLAAKHLVEDIERKGWHLSTGFVGVSYLCPILTETGYGDVAYHLLNNDTFPSWGYSIKNGATTIWERWDGWTEEHGFQTPTMNSFNHYSLGSVGQWLYQYVAGIRPDPEQPGFRHIIIRPYPGGGLTYARAEYHAMSGTISSHWTDAQDAFTLRLTIPINTTATVYLPAPEHSEIFEGNGPAGDGQGITFLRREGERAVFEVDSGIYEFRVQQA